MIAEALVDASAAAGPTALLAGLAVLSLVFGQLISNTATALVMIPIGLSAAEQLGVSGRTVLMSICVACAAAFMTPVATPANLMVMGPGGYRFGDYWKLGLPLMVLFFGRGVRRPADLAVVTPAPAPGPRSGMSSVTRWAYTAPGATRRRPQRPLHVGDRLLLAW